MSKCQPELSKKVTIDISARLAQRKDLAESMQNWFQQAIVEIIRA